MPESPQLVAARNHLATAERLFATADGLFHLEEALALLDETCEGDTQERSVAQNLAASYAAKTFARVHSAITTDRAVPQPQLELFFKLMLAFDAGDFELPKQAREAKIGVVRRLIDLLYEGYPPAVKQAALARLNGIVRDE